MIIQRVKTFRQNNSVGLRPLSRILQCALYFPLWMKFTNYLDKNLL